MLHIGIGILIHWHLHLINASPRFVECEMHRAWVLVRMDCRLKEPAFVLQRPHAAGQCAVRGIQGRQCNSGGHVCGRRAGPSHRVARGVLPQVPGLRGHGGAQGLCRHSPARAINASSRSGRGLQSLDDRERVLFGFHSNQVIGAWSGCVPLPKQFVNTPSLGGSRHLGFMMTLGKWRGLRLIHRSAF